ncbi:hypothetical protein [Gimesia maris]|uniref:hypothetical protein n=1 Tax=Gimesia maris TaxID=122 RepID=UPI0032EEED91
MGQKDCGLSLIKKPCVRKRFPCSRCGAKIVNAGLAWEASVPTYKQWHYMDPGDLSVNGSGITSPVAVTAPRVATFNDPEISGPSPCAFSGESTFEGLDLVQGQTPADAGALALDFEWQRFDDGLDGWNWFLRNHWINVDWEAAVVDDDSGELITPGRWRLTLTIKQSAQGYLLNYNEDTGGTGFFNFALGGSFEYPFGAIPLDPTDAFGGVSVIRAIYYPPAGFKCFVPAGEVSRWTRDVPDLPLLFDPHTIETLPEEYQWPSGVPEYVEGMPVTYSDPFFPTGFSQSNDIYYAPPYIDVRHVPK